MVHFVVRVYNSTVTTPTQGFSARVSNRPDVVRKATGNRRGHPGFEEEDRARGIEITLDPRERAALDFVVARRGVRSKSAAVGELVVEEAERHGATLPPKPVPKKPAPAATPKRPRAKRKP
ncbi:MAG: hypothetical protein JWM87_770 [Candidatus Eremiobacteraeota bacterium]|nr:hypothetical protein [Candidatus Eremiobacteraeota bacterium]